MGSNVIEWKIPLIFYRILMKPSLNRMKQGVKRFMKVDADDALKLPVGIVTFTDTANIVQEIKPVVGTQAREGIKKIMLNSTSGRGRGA